MMTEIRTILFASDLSPESDRAFEHARFLAERFDAYLTIYHGLEMPRSQYAGWVDVDDDRRARWEQRVREDLSRRASTLKIPHEVVVQGQLVGGHFLVDLALLEVIHKTRPDLTVMATRGRKGFASFFLGSVTEQVVQHAGQPVLCVRKSGHGLVLPYQRLLVPTDLSPASRRAFPLAALLARSFEASVLGLYVVPAPTLATLAGVPDAPAPRVPAADEVRRVLLPDFEGVPVEARVCTTGAPWHRIVQSAEEQKTDLVVMSTRGHDSVHDAIIGSNAERVLRHAPCPVLVV
jgi:nucleotide-binding universal stress UspA family protein